MPISLHLFLFGSFLPRGISLIFYIQRPLLSQGRRKYTVTQIHHEILNQYLGAHKSRLTKSSLALLQKLLRVNRTAGSLSKRQEANWADAAQLIGNHIFKSLGNASCKGLWKKVLATEMILNHFAGRLTPQVKYLNRYPKTSSRDTPGMAVCDAKGKTQNPNVQSSVSSHSSPI